MFHLSARTLAFYETKVTNTKVIVLLSYGCLFYLYCKI